MQAVSTMRATDILAFSLIVKLLPAIATRAFMSRCSERNVFYYVSDCPLHGFRADGGQLPVGSCHQSLKFVSRLHILKNQIVITRLVGVLGVYLAWVGSSALVSYEVPLLDSVSKPNHVAPPFPPRSSLYDVITRLKLSLHYMTRTIQMIDYQKHLYFCSCHNIKIIGFAKTPLDLYLFSKNFLLVIIEALFSQRLFQSPPFWLFRQPLHIFQ